MGWEGQGGRGREKGRRRSKKGEEGKGHMRYSKEGSGREERSWRIYGRWKKGVGERGGTEGDGEERKSGEKTREM